MTTTTPSKKKKWIIGISIAIAITIITILLIRRRRKKNQAAKEEQALENVVENKLPPNPNGANRGLRNNNPGNIRLTTQAWKGKIPNAQNTDGAFEQFTDKTHGIRAMIRTLKTYIEKGTATTLAAIISRYAPGSENPTDNYIENVSKATGIAPLQTIAFDKETMKNIVPAMATMESGKGAITATEFNEAWKILA